MYTLYIKITILFIDCVYGTIKIKKGECFYSFGKYMWCDETNDHKPIFRKGSYEFCAPKKV